MSCRKAGSINRTVRFLKVLTSIFHFVKLEIEWEIKKNGGNTDKMLMEAYYF